MSSDEFLAKIQREVDRLKAKDRRCYYLISQSLGSDGFRVVEALKKYAESVGWIIEVTRCKSCKGSPKFDIIIGWEN